MKLRFQNDAVLSVEVLSTDEQRRRGLMGRASLPAHSGALFLFPHLQASHVWMKDTAIPLDAAWLRDGRIVSVARNLRPYSQNPVYGPLAHAILEVNAGWFDAHGIDVGSYYQG